VRQKHTKVEQALKQCLLQLEYAEAAQQLQEHPAWKVILASLHAQEQFAVNDLIRSDASAPEDIATLRAGIRCWRFLANIPKLKVAEIAALKRRVEGLQEQMDRLQTGGHTADYAPVEAGLAAVNEDLQGA
jgi:hypothetical protein